MKISFIACVVLVSVVQVEFMVRIRLRYGFSHDSELCFALQLRYQVGLWVRVGYLSRDRDRAQVWWEFW